MKKPDYYKAPLRSRADILLGQGETTMQRRIFMSEGIYWWTQSVVDEENKLFRWKKVTAVWSGFGPRPVFADDTRTFFIRRQRKSDGHWIT